MKSSASASVELEPPGVVTDTLTVPAADAGDTAEIDVSDSTVNVAVVEPNCTDVAPSRLLPVMTTVVLPVVGPTATDSDVTTGIPK